MSSNIKISTYISLINAFYDLYKNPENNYKDLINKYFYSYELTDEVENKIKNNLISLKELLNDKINMDEQDFKKEYLKIYKELLDILTYKVLVNIFIYKLLKICELKKYKVTENLLSKLTSMKPLEIEKLYNQYYNDLSDVGKKLLKSKNASIISEVFDDEQSLNILRKYEKPEKEQMIQYFIEHYIVPRSNIERNNEKFKILNFLSKKQFNLSYDNLQRDQKLIILSQYNDIINKLQTDDKDISTKNDIAISKYNKLYYQLSTQERRQLDEFVNNKKEAVKPEAVKPKAAKRIEEPEAVDEIRYKAEEEVLDKEIVKNYTDYFNKIRDLIEFKIKNSSFYTPSPANIYKLIKESPYTYKIKQFNTDMLLGKNLDKIKKLINNTNILDKKIEKTILDNRRLKNEKYDELINHLKQLADIREKNNKTITDAIDDVNQDFDKLKQREDIINKTIAENNNNVDDILSSIKSKKLYKIKNTIYNRDSKTKTRVNNLKDFEQNFKQYLNVNYNKDIEKIDPKEINAINDIYKLLGNNIQMHNNLKNITQEMTAKKNKLYELKDMFTFPENNDLIKLKTFRILDNNFVNNNLKTHDIIENIIFNKYPDKVKQDEENTKDKDVLEKIIIEQYNELREDRLYTAPNIKHNADDDLANIVTLINNIKLYIDSFGYNKKITDIFDEISSNKDILHNINDKLIDIKLDKISDIENEKIKDLLTEDSINKIKELLIKNYPELTEPQNKEKYEKIIDNLYTTDISDLKKAVSDFNSGTLFENVYKAVKEKNKNMTLNDINVKFKEAIRTISDSIKGLKPWKGPDVNIPEEIKKIWEEYNNQVRSVNNIEGLNKHIDNIDKTILRINGDKEIPVQTFKYNDEDYNLEMFNKNLLEKLLNDLKSKKEDLYDKLREEQLKYLEKKEKEEEEKKKLSIKTPIPIKKTIADALNEQYNKIIDYELDQPLEYYENKKKELTDFIKANPRYRVRSKERMKQFDYQIQLLMKKPAKKTYKSSYDIKEITDPSNNDTSDKIIKNLRQLETLIKATGLATKKKELKKNHNILLKKLSVLDHKKSLYYINPLDVKRYNNDKYIHIMRHILSTSEEDENTSKVLYAVVARIKNLQKKKSTGKLSATKESELNTLMELLNKIKKKHEDEIDDFLIKDEPEEQLLLSKDEILENLNNNLLLPNELKKKYAKIIKNYEKDEIPVISNINKFTILDKPIKNIEDLRDLKALNGLPIQILKEYLYDNLYYKEDDDGLILSFDQKDGFLPLEDNIYIYNPSTDIISSRPPSVPLRNPEGDTSEEDTSEGDTTEEDTPEGDTTEEDTSEEDTSEGAAEGDTSEEDTSEEDDESEKYKGKGLSDPLSNPAKIRFIVIDENHNNYDVVISLKNKQDELTFLTRFIKAIYNLMKRKGFTRIIKIKYRYGKPSTEMFSKLDEDYLIRLLTMNRGNNESLTSSYRKVGIYGRGLKENKIISLNDLK